MATTALLILDGFGIGKPDPKSNAIYGRSTTVQPAAYYVHIWHRVA